MKPHFYFSFYVTEFPLHFKKKNVFLFLCACTKSSVLHIGTLKASTPTPDQCWAAHWQTEADREASFCQQKHFAQRGVRGSTEWNCWPWGECWYLWPPLRSSGSSWWWRKGRWAAKRKSGRHCLPLCISSSERRKKSINRKRWDRRRRENINNVGKEAAWGVLGGTCSEDGRTKEEGKRAVSRENGAAGVHIWAGCRGEQEGDVAGCWTREGN